MTRQREHAAGDTVRSKPGQAGRSYRSVSHILLDRGSKAGASCRGVTGPRRIFPLADGTQVYFSVEIFLVSKLMRQIAGTLFNLYDDHMERNLLVDHMVHNLLAGHMVRNEICPLCYCFKKLP